MNSHACRILWTQKPLLHIFKLKSFVPTTFRPNFKNQNFGDRISCHLDYYFFLSIYILFTPLNHINPTCISPTNSNFIWISPNPKGLSTPLSLSLSFFYIMNQRWSTMSTSTPPSHLWTCWLSYSRLLVPFVWRARWDPMLTLQRFFPLSPSLSPLSPHYGPPIHFHPLQITASIPTPQRPLQHC
jgi:hypothetical protein